MTSPRRRRPSLGHLGVLGVVAGLVASTWVSAATASVNPTQRVEPSRGLPLTQRMSTLFRAITTDSTAIAAPLFFPESAYVSMKTGQIPAPASDYRERLVALYRLDLARYHHVIVAQGAAAFVGVNVAGTRAQWISPGDCENSIGYWHVPGVRLVYRLAGVVRSVAVDSLISWRGVWYVVHLGPNPRRLNVGTLDAPALGRGRAGPPGGC